MKLFWLSVFLLSFWMNISSIECEENIQLHNPFDLSVLLDDNSTDIDFKDLLESSQTLVSNLTLLENNQTLNANETVNLRTEKTDLKVESEKTEVKEEDEDEDHEYKPVETEVELSMRKKTKNYEINKTLSEPRYDNSQVTDLKEREKNILQQAKVSIVQEHDKFLKSNRNLTYLKKQENDIENNLKVLRDERNELKKKIDQFQKEGKSELDQLKDKLRSAQEKRAGVLKRIKELEDEKNYLESEILKIKEELKSDQAKLGEFHKSIADLKKKLKSTQESLKEILNELKNIDSLLSQAENGYSNSYSYAPERKNENTRYLSSKQELLSRKKEKPLELAIMKQTYDEIKAQLKQQSEKYLNDTVYFKNKEQELIKLIEAKKIKLEAINNQIKAATDEETIISKNILSLEKLIAEVSEELQKTIENLDARMKDIIMQEETLLKDLSNVNLDEKNKLKEIQTAYVKEKDQLEKIEKLLAEGYSKIEELESKRETEFSKKLKVQKILRWLEEDLKYEKERFEKKRSQKYSKGYSKKKLDEEEEEVLREILLKIKETNYLSKRIDTQITKIEDDIDDLRENQHKLEIDRIRLKSDVKNEEKVLSIEGEEINKKIIKLNEEIEAKKKFINERIQKEQAYVENLKNQIRDLEKNKMFYSRDEAKLDKEIYLHHQRINDIQDEISNKLIEAEFWRKNDDEKRIKAEKRLEKLTSDLNRIRSAIKSLSKPTNDSISYLKKDNTSQDQERVSGLRKKLADLEQTRADIDAKIRAEFKKSDQERIEGIENLIKSNKLKIKEAQYKKNKLIAEKNNSTEQMRQLKQDQDEINKQIYMKKQDSNRHIKELGKSLKANQEKKVKIHALLTQTIEEKNTITDEIESLKTEAESSQNVKQDIENQKKLIEDIEKKEKSIENSKKHIDKLISQLEAHEVDLYNKQTAYSSDQYEYKSIADQLEKISNKREQLIKARRIKEDQASKVILQLDEARSKLDTLLEKDGTDNNDAHEKVSLSESKLLDVNTKISKLNEEIEKISESIKNSNQSIQEQINRVRIALTDLGAKKQQIKEQEESLQTRITQIDEELNMISVEITKLEHEIKTNEKRLEATTKVNTYQIQELTNQRFIINEQIAKIKSELGNLKSGDSPTYQDTKVKQNVEKLRNYEDQLTDEEEKVIDEVITLSHKEETDMQEIYDLEDKEDKIQAIEYSKQEKMNKKFELEGIIKSIENHVKDKARALLKEKNDISENRRILDEMEQLGPIEPFFPNVIPQENIQDEVEYELDSYDDENDDQVVALSFGRSNTEKEKPAYSKIPADLMLELLKKMDEKLSKVLNNSDHLRLKEFDDKYVLLSRLTHLFQSVSNQLDNSFMNQYDISSQKFDEILTILDHFYEKSEQNAAYNSENRNTSPDLDKLLRRIDENSYSLSRQLEYETQKVLNEIIGEIKHIDNKASNAYEKLRTEFEKKMRESTEKIEHFKNQNNLKKSPQSNEPIEKNNQNNGRKDEVESINNSIKNFYNKYSYPFNYENEDSEQPDQTEERIAEYNINLSNYQDLEEPEMNFTILLKTQEESIDQEQQILPDELVDSDEKPLVANEDNFEHDLLEIDELKY